MSQADVIRDQQRQAWDRFSAGWTKWDSVVFQMLAPVGEEMIRSLNLSGDEVHLDVASGTGEPGLTIASVLPRGRVTLTDLSPGMLKGATQNAEARGLKNVEVRECGADSLPFEDSFFDTVSCRFGLMFFPDVATAVAEQARVLRPGGRISVSVWAEPPGNPWATIPMAAIGAEVELPTPSPDAPGLFRCAMPGVIADTFRDAGLGNVIESDVVCELDVASADEYWAFMTDVAAPVVAGLALADEPATRRIKEAAIRRARGFEADGRIHLPIHARCVTGTR